MFSKWFKNILSILIQKWNFIIIFGIINCNSINNLYNFNPENIKTIKNSIAMELVEIPKGSFRMGCGEADQYCDEDEKPSDKKEIQDKFYLGKYEVTVRDFSLFVKETNYKTDAEKKGFLNTWRNCENKSLSKDHPVICVSWNDAVEFTKWLSNKEGKKYRLPEEVEWEYSARVFQSTKYYWGFDFDESYAWYNKNSDRTPHKVGLKERNNFGLHDILGNVREWCLDDYNPNYFKENKSIINSKKGKAIRGGSWFDSFTSLRVSARSYMAPDMKDDITGFRILLESN